MTFHSTITGKSYKTEAARKAAESRFGKPKSLEGKEAIRAAFKKTHARWLSGELEPPRRGKKNTPEHNAAIAKANRRKQDPEHVAKRSIAGGKTRKERFQEGRYDETKMRTGKINSLKQTARYAKMRLEKETERVNKINEKANYLQELLDFGKGETIDIS